LNYEEMTKIYDVKDPKKRGADFKLDLDTQLQVVRTNKSLWREKINENDPTDCQVKKKVYDRNIEDPYLLALMLYKKGEFLKVIPYFPSEETIEKTLQTTVKVPDHLSKRAKQTRELRVDVTQNFMRVNLYPEHSIELLDSNQAESMLGDQDLLLFRFVFKKQETPDMRENAFICVTNNQISAVSDEGHEVGRISGLEISHAMVLDTNYLYVTQNSVSQLHEQYASFDSDWILSPKQEITRLEKASETFSHINYATIFSGRYTEIHVTGSALGFNGTILRNYTTDVV